MKLNLNTIAHIQNAELIEDGDLYKQGVLNLILAALVDPSFLSPERNKPRLVNDDLATLAYGRVPESVILRIIELYAGDYETSCKDLFRLRRRGVGDKILEAIISKAFKSELELERRNND